MNTRDLARKLGAVEVIRAGKKGPLKQPFDFLLVLDFEATCWANSETKRHCNEIIEFPVVLYDIKNAKIVKEFQQYVMPTENPKLSEFCISLTGIQQTQVDNGVPLATCLLLFMRWLSEIKQQYDINLPSDENQGKYKCTFATWSDWDLGTCLKNECRRKRINYHKMFHKWIDIRKLFKIHYKTPPNGLFGALSELGLEFEGKEHCGLHDARNTAKLIGKMMEQGVVLQLTRT